MIEPRARVGYRAYWHGFKNTLGGIAVYYGSPESAISALIRQLRSDGIADDEVDIRDIIVETNRPK